MTGAGVHRVIMVPRVVSEHPMCLDVAPGRPLPVRARDDLDPHAPPMEYADGRISWSGATSRAERDAARAREADDLCRRRSAQDPRLVATRALMRARDDLSYYPEMVSSEALPPAGLRRYHAEAYALAAAAWAAGGREWLAYDAGCCTHPHPPGRHCPGCRPCWTP